MIDALLRLVQNGQQALNLQTVDIRVLLAPNLSKAYGRSPGGTKTNFNLSEPLTRGDPNDVAPVWENVSRSAIKYTATRNPAT